MGGARCFPLRRTPRRKGLLHPDDAAAECDGTLAYRTRARQHLARHPCTPASSAGLRLPMAARHRPCGHSNPAFSFQTLERARGCAQKSFARRILGSHLAVERAVRQHDLATAATLGRVLRLAEGALYHGRRTFARRTASFLALHDQG